MSEDKDKSAKPEEAPETGWRSWVPWVLLGLFSLTILSGLRPEQSAPEAINDADFGRLPVLLGGRVKPLDSVARNALLQIAGQQRLPIEGNGPGGAWGDLIEMHDAHDGKGLTFSKFYQFNRRPQKLSAREWLMEVLMRPEKADRRFVFRIDLPELLAELKLEELGVDQSGLRYYSFEQLQPHILKLQKLTGRIEVIDEKLRSPYQRAVVTLAGKIVMYNRLRFSLQPNPLEVPSKRPVNDDELDEWLNEQRAQQAINASSSVACADFSADLARLRRGLPALEGEDAPDANALYNLRFLLLSQFGEQADTGTTSEEQLAVLVESASEELADRLAEIEAQRADNPGPQRLADLLQLEHQINQFKTTLEWVQSVAPTPAEQMEVVRYLFDSAIYGSMGQRASLQIIPPREPNPEDKDWQMMGNAIQEKFFSGEAAKQDLALRPAVEFYAAMSSAYVANQPEAFNKAVADYNQWLTENKYIRETRKGREEFFFNAFAPFARAMGVYLVALLLAGFSWLNLSRWLSRSAFYLVGLALVVHTVGLIFRMYLEGRPPVTNLYSSAVFCGWGAVLLGWFLERIYRNGIGSFTAAAIGFATLIIARHLAQEGDTMKMVQAVLDTNFWLATHVTSITIGYSATFLAGFLALVYVLRGVFTPSLKDVTAKALARMVYGIICFATLFSFVGTVLGGIWADQSWGRFWGWDAKENGALLIVIWNALLLHAKWGGLVRDRGLMSLAILGNVVTAWSWFGTNMLGIGLHSYGFMDGAFDVLKWFAIGHVLFSLIATHPVRNWLSAAHLAGAKPEPVGKIATVLLGLGLLLQLTSLWTHPFAGYLGCTLVGAGLLLSFLPPVYTASSSRKTA